MSVPWLKQSLCSPKTNSISLSKNGLVFQQLSWVRGGPRGIKKLGHLYSKLWVSVWDASKKMLLLPDRRNRNKQPTMFPSPLVTTTIFGRRRKSLFQSVTGHFVIVRALGSTSQTCTVLPGMLVLNLRFETEPHTGSLTIMTQSHHFQFITQ